MNTCGTCESFRNGICIMSGFIGCKDDDFLKVKETDISCDSYSYNEKELDI